MPYRDSRVGWDSLTGVAEDATGVAEADVVVVLRSAVQARGADVSNLRDELRSLRAVREAPSALNSAGALLVCVRVYFQPELRGIAGRCGCVEELRRSRSCGNNPEQLSLK
jgi:hypothetical protein